MTSPDKDNGTSPPENTQAAPQTHVFSSNEEVFQHSLHLTEDHQDDHGYTQLHAAHTIFNQQGNYPEARQRAQNILDDPEASPAMKQGAEALIRAIQLDTPTLIVISMCVAFFVFVVIRNY